MRQTTRTPRLFMLLGALLCGTGAHGAGNYTQDFSAAPLNWSAANDSWTASGDYANQVGQLPPSLAWYTGNSWTTNFTYKVRAYSDWWNTGNRLGVVFGFADPTHYYQVTIAMDGKVWLERANGNSSTPQLIATQENVPANLGLAVDTWFDFEVYVNGDAVIVKVNGKVAMPLTSLGATPPSGRIGLIARADLAHFDDVTITDYVATQLFRGNFTQDDGTAIDLGPANINCTLMDGSVEKSCYAKISGTDSSGYKWPVSLWTDPAVQNDGGLLHYMSRSKTGTVDQFVAASIRDDVVGHGGTVTHVLEQRLLNEGSEGPPQLPYAIRPKNTFAQQHDLYMRFWLNYPDGLSGYWQMPFQFVTDGSFANQDPRALRVSLFATTSNAYNFQQCTGPDGGNPNSQWHWIVQGDRDPDHVLWQECNATAEVPLGRWFKVEIFVQRAKTATSNGRIWVAIDGHEVLDRIVPPTEGGMYANGAPISRLNLPQMYGGDAWLRRQYVDDVEFWNGFPSNATADVN